MRKTPPLSGSHNVKKHSKLGLWENRIHRKQFSAEFAQTLPYTQKNVEELGIYFLQYYLSLFLEIGHFHCSSFFTHTNKFWPNKKMAKRKQKPHVFIINRNICLSTPILCIQNVLIYLRPSFHSKNVCKYLIIMWACVRKIIRSLF